MHKILCGTLLVLGSIHMVQASCYQYGVGQSQEYMNCTNQEAQQRRMQQQQEQMQRQIAQQQREMQRQQEQMQRQRDLYEQQMQQQRNQSYYRY